MRSFWMAFLAVMFIVTLANAEVVLQPLRGDAKRGPNLVPNAGFEEVVAGKPDGWKVELSGNFSADTQTFHSGKASLRFTKPEAQTVFWVSRSIEINQKRPAPLVISGWSKAENVVGSRGGNYSVWVDLQYTDGTPLWGQKAICNAGTHDWQYVELPFVVAKPIKAATVNVLFRGSFTGTVWFDDIALQEMSFEGGGIFDGGAVAQPASFKAETRPVSARLTTQDGLALGLDETGAVAEFSADGRSLLSGAPGGLWLRDVAASGPWLRPSCRVQRDGDAVRIEGEEASAGLRLTATLTPRQNAIDIEATVQDTTGADRAVTMAFVLPLADRQWTWHDDIVRSLPVAPQSEYKNAQAWPSAGMASAYPFCSVTTDGLGLSLSVPMDCPRVCRFACNTWYNALFAAFDFGLAKEPVKFPSRADFRLSISRHAPEWGFRAAAQSYYERFPQFFEQRLKRGGIWMAFADISKVKDFEDFGFAYDELGGKHAKFDGDHGIASFTYIEPMTYWLPMAQKYPRTYEGAMQALADNEKSGKPGLVSSAQATRRCSAFTRDGLYDLSIENQSWCDGAVFTLNPDPNIPEDAACPKNKGHLGYSKEWADKNLLQKEGGCVDGIYIDSMPNWGEVRNWRREHWRTVEVPLTFDPETRQPVLLQIFSTWQFSKWVADDVHARGGVMHGNGGACWPYFPALLDITGQETGGILPDETMARARTLLRNKPYSPLMNTRFDQMGPEQVVDYFNKSLLYDIFPSFFNGTYMKDGKWVNVHYFTDPKFYERDRPLFKKYIPILRRMFDAGWQPVTYARAEPAGVRVERYGPAANNVFAHRPAEPAGLNAGHAGLPMRKNTGEVLFAVYNPAAAAVTAKLLVDAAALKLAARPSSATALVSGAKPAISADGARVVVSLPISAKTCEVVLLECNK